MTKRTLAAIGLSGAALAAVSGATPAYAAPDCGTVPAGATLTVLDSTTCQLDFAAAGTFNWTVPTGAAGIQALLVGAGGGTGSTDTIGYGGSGGAVLYVDYSAVTPGTSVDVVVGAGGVSNDGADGLPGDNTTTTVSAVTETADGGIGGVLPSASFCVPEGDGGVVAANGSSATTILAGSTGACETSFALGLNPSTAPTDSYGNTTPAIFSSLSSVFGAGGRILPTATALSADAALIGTGNGADMHHNSAISEFDGTNAAGGSGRVTVRYTTTALAAALAATGVEAASTLTIAGVAAGAGAILLATSRRRKRA